MVSNKSTSSEGILKLKVKLFLFKQGKGLHGRIYRCVTVFPRVDSACIVGQVWMSYWTLVLRVQWNPAYNGHPRYNEQFWKSRLSLQYLSNPWIGETPLLCIMDSFCGPIVRKQYLRPRFSEHSSTFSARLSTITAVVHNISVFTRSTRLCLLSLPCQCAAMKTQPHRAQQPD